MISPKSWVPAATSQGCYGVTRPCALHCVPSAPDAGDKGHGDQEGAVHQPRYLTGASNLVRVSYRVEASYQEDAS